MCRNNRRNSFHLNDDRIVDEQISAEVADNLFAVEDFDGSFE